MLNAQRACDITDNEYFQCPSLFYSGLFPRSFDYFRGYHGVMAPFFTLLNLSELKTHIYANLNFDEMQGFSRRQA